MRSACPETYVACALGCGDGPCDLQRQDLFRMTDPTPRRPTMEETMMDVARLMARRSTCARLQVGCVITNLRLTTIYSVGYNGNYRGGPNECDREEPGNCGCLHAEDNALVKLKTEERGLVLFTTVSPCVACAKRIVNQGNILTAWWCGEAHRDLDASAAILATGGVAMRLLGTRSDDVVGKRYLCRAVLDEHATLDACREADGATVTEPVVHGEGCRCTYEPIYN